MADPLRDAAERLLQQLELRRQDPDAPLILERAESELRAALAAQPPAAATDTPLDIDALLSPEGAYERVSHGGNGAQLVSGRHGERGEWWRPVVGMDTLENLLDRIRTRILPHLRPPIAGIDVPGGDGDYGGLQELCEAEGVDLLIGAPLLKRAREAWKVAAQPPAAAPASDGEREELAAWLREKADDERLWRGSTGDNQASLNLARAADLLREPAPAPAAVPVAVSERPWERDGWLHPEEGWCWYHNGPSVVCNSRWYLIRLNVDFLVGDDGWLLPYWAIPIPQPPHGGEVADA